MEVQQQLINTLGDFPGGPVVKNMTSNAGDMGDMGSSPGRGTKMPHAMVQLSQYATIKDPACHN